MVHKYGKRWRHGSKSCLEQRALNGIRNESRYLLYHRDILCFIKLGIECSHSKTIPWDATTNHRVANPHIISQVCCDCLFSYVNWLWRLASIVDRGLKMLHPMHDLKMLALKILYRCFELDSNRGKLLHQNFENIIYFLACRYTIKHSSWIYVLPRRYFAKRNLRMQIYFGEFRRIYVHTFKYFTYVNLLLIGIRNIDLFSLLQIPT